MMVKELDLQIYRCEDKGLTGLFYAYLLQVTFIIELAEKNRVYVS